MNDFERVREQLRRRLRPLGELNIERSPWIPAAVALILREWRGQPEILIIKRAEHPRDPWSGHLAFPGGRAEPGDRDLRMVAIRETREEVGIDLEAGGEFLGRLETVRPGNPRLPRIAITPLVVVVSSHQELQPDSREVKEAFWLPLLPLKREGRSALVQRVVQGNLRAWPAYPSAHGSIWGITERILTQLLALLD
ncbi:MAG: CoA pyrophosphatase [Acidobacteria bacterium]|nr:MAG: CoA pyrophosphatase [Acidobacteriota bacterium]